jgi:multiple sugar transport system substrate-binding protein
VTVQYAGTGADGRVLFFNKKLLAKAGLPPPGSPRAGVAAGRPPGQGRLPGVTPLQINAGTAMGEATTAQGFIALLSRPR